MKGKSILLIVVLVIIVIGAFLVLRGGSTTEEIPETLLPTAVDDTGTLPIATPAASPVSGLPTDLASPTASPSTAASAAVSITAAGFTPATVTVPVNGTVTFTNSDTQPHQVASDPHPSHTNFPALNGDVLAAGKSRTVTFTKAGTFGYHDHLNPGTRGTVTVK